MKSRLKKGKTHLRESASDVHEECYSRGTRDVVYLCASIFMLRSVSRILEEGGRPIHARTTGDGGRVVCRKSI